jgi:ribosomal protein S18 acetylase RimI-like enzyme
VTLDHLYILAFNFPEAMGNDLSYDIEQKMIQIIHAQSEDDYRRARKLFEQYADDLGLDLEFQGFSRELATLPGAYAPPGGCILLAEKQEEIVGCVALRPLDKRICEMKRLYVMPGHRHQKIGRLLVEAVIDRARAYGYERMRLDTIDSMNAAQTLYRSLGFRPIKAYRYNPLNHPSYFELNLHK